MKVCELMELLRGLDPDQRVGVQAAGPWKRPFDRFNVELIGVRIDRMEPRLRVGLITAETLYTPDAL